MRLQLCVSTEAFATQPGARLTRLCWPMAGATCVPRPLKAFTASYPTPAGVVGLQRWGLLPAAVAADPVLLLVLLAGSVMPTAQNLVRRQRDATSMTFLCCSLWRKHQLAHPCLA